LGYTTSIIVLLVGFVLFVNAKPDLSVWHTAELDGEFTASSNVHSFEEYLELERRLFAQLEERVFERIEPSERRQINRFHRGSLSDPSCTRRVPRYSACAFPATARPRWGSRACAGRTWPRRCVWPHAT
jgi:hypothetical protein